MRRYINLALKRDVLDNSFTDQFSKHIKLSYSFYDRIIVRGYINSMFKPSSVIALLRNLGFSKHTNGIIKLMSDQLNSHIKKLAEREDIPLLWRESYGGKDLKMQSFVEENYYHENKFGPICIIKSLEHIGCYWNKQITTKEGKPFTKMYWCKKPVTQHYIYINDKELGLCCLKISSGLPFHCQFYCNGHQYLKREFDKKGVKYKMDENAFIDIGDKEVLNNLVSEFKGSVIDSVINRWMRVWFSFDKGSRSRCSSLLRHNWYTSQCEVCSNIVFKNSGYFDRLYDKIIEKHHKIGLPDSLSKVFDLKRERNQSQSTQKVYYQKACVKHWINGNSIKMYNKGGYMLRVETTINNPGLPGAKLQKPLYEIKGYYWYGYGCNNRFFEAISAIDSKLIGDTETNLTKAVETEKGKKVAAPDLRDPKQVVLLAVLSNCRFSAEWFRTKELMRYLSGYYSKTAEIRYQIEKLKVRKLIEKRQGANYYRVTKKGHAWINIAYCQNRYFLTPLLSADIENEIRGKIDGFDKFESALTNIKKELMVIYQQLNIAA